MDAVGRHAVEDVRVQIDEAGRHGLPRDVNDAPGFRGRDVRGHPSDLPVLHRHVQRPAQVLRRVDHVAALQQ
jgi:hypothetical protein